MLLPQVTARKSGGAEPRPYNNPLNKTIPRHGGGWFVAVYQMLFALRRRTALRMARTMRIMAMISSTTTAKAIMVM